jgi:nucleotide-binding universal stress UspA family protein
MPKTIIVPLDGSDRATEAVSIARWMADGFGADLRLLSATAGGDSGRERATLRHGRDLASVESVRVDIVEHERPAEAILDAAAGSPDTVICMTTRGHGATGSMLFGSVAHQVVNQAAGPIVLVGPRLRDKLDDPQDLVVCLTEPGDREVMLPLARDWARELDLRLHIVQVVEPGHRPPEPVQADGAKIGLTIDVNRDTMDPDDVTVGLAHGLDAALIVVATDGRNPPSHEPTGHVASDIIRHSHCPVLVRRVPAP